MARRQTKTRNEQPVRSINATTDTARTNFNRAPQLPGHSDSTASHGQNVAGSATATNRADRSTGQPPVSDDFKQLRRQQQQLTGPIKIDLTKRLRGLSKADQPDQSRKSDRTQTDPSRAGQNHPDHQPTQRPSEPNDSRNNGPSR
ncbi:MULTISPECIES: hypothetical protein [Lactobacillaceae]|uniref:hypothetical protein n=1 Tax=Lactobacillaceae TaxID=33958 RepID=UPI001CC1E2EB|nr:MULTISPECIES: hypothetical protein [Lactobacillaceae]